MRASAAWVAVALLVAACEAPSTCDGSSCVDAGLPGQDWGNAAAVLSGGRLGAERVDNAMLSKTITAIASGDARFSIISATLSRPEATTESADLTIRVRNVGSTGACFIRANPLVFRGTGEALDAGNGYVNGSVRSLASGVSTNTCLLPGEDGFLIDLESMDDGGTLYSSVNSVEFTWASSPTMQTAPAARVIPVTYDATSVTAINQGTRTATLGIALGYGVYLEREEGRSVELLFRQSAGKDVGAGARITFGFFSTFEGSATQFYANVGDYSDCTTCSRALTPPTTLQERAALQHLVRDRTDALREQLSP